MSADPHRFPSPTATDGPQAEDRRAGVVSRVGLGSLWGSSGPGVALVVSLVATPFVIRELGAEWYGALGLVHVLLAYLTTAGAGIGQAATRRAALALAAADVESEAAAVWTALLLRVAIASTAGVLVLWSSRAIAASVLGLPPHLVPGFIAALAIGTLGYVARSVAEILATPQLARLYFGRTSLIDGIVAVLQVGLVPVALWWHGPDIAAAVAVGTATALLGLLVYGGLAPSTAPALWRPRVDGTMAREFLRFSASAAAMSASAVLLASGEKVLLARAVSTTALAYYSVAFTASQVLAVLPAAVSRSLIPALAGVSHDARRLHEIYERSLRAVFLVSLPLAVALGTIAAPFLTIWAGAEFGRESALPLNLLLLGSVADGLGLVARSYLVATGRPELVARYQAITLLPYLGLAALVIAGAGIAGAASAWTVRAIVECAAMLWLASRDGGPRPWFLPQRSRRYLLLVGALGIPAWFLLLATGRQWPAAAVAALLLAFHAVEGWGRLLTPTERHHVQRWLRGA